MSNDKDILDEMDPSHPDYDPDKDPLVQRAYWLMENHPICKLVTDLCRSHERLQRMANMQAPVFVLTEERRMREKAIAALTAAVPINPDLEVPVHTVAYTIELFRGEMVAGIRNDPTLQKGERSDA